MIGPDEPTPAVEAAGTAETAATASIAERAGSTEATGEPPSIEPREPLSVARAMRWKLASSVLIDPFTWVGVAVISWVAYRVGGGVPTGLAAPVVALAAALGGAALATWLADDLLFNRRENELLRAQPLTTAHLLELRRDELGWWLWPARLVAAAGALGAGGWPLAAGVLVAWVALPSLGLVGATAARSRLGRRGAGGSALILGSGAAVLLGPMPRLLPDGATAWTAELLALLPGGALAAATLPLAGLLLLGFLASKARSPLARYRALASDAAAAPSRQRGVLWRAGERLLPLPAGLRSRLLRDLALLTRGQDLRGAALLLAAPLSCLYLADQLTVLKDPAALTWRALEATALGGVLVAYAVGPGIHGLRCTAMAWERVAPNAGRDATRAALLYAFLFAGLHGLLVLLTVALVDGGHFAPRVPGLLLPILGLDLAMAHYVVAFTVSNSDGRRVAGEGTLVLSLTVVAAIVAIVGLLMPPAVLAYFILTAGMVAAARARFDSVEVTW